MDMREEDRKKSISNNFNLKTELSNLVEKKIIPSKIAEKLQQKLEEKNIKLDEQQLYNLIDRIKDIMIRYSKYGQQGKKDLQGEEKTQNEDMLNLVQKIENLEEKIKKIETDETKNKVIIDEKGRIFEDIEKTPKFIDPEDTRGPKIIKGYTNEQSTDPLTELPTDPESIIILMKWLQHLIDKCGHLNLTKILDYYVDVNWISPDVKISLIDYSHGITDETGKLNTIKKEIIDLPSKDHIQSFIFIQKLKGKQFDRHFIDRIENDISRITKKIDEYQYK
jgi:flagellar protein FlaD